MGKRCRRCHGYTSFPPCRCQLLGWWWMPELGETEKNGRELWGFALVDVALEKAIELLDGDCAGELFSCDDSPILVRFRPVDNGKRQKCVSYEVSAEFVRSYRAETTAGAFVSEVAEGLRRRRKMERARRARELQEQ